MKFGIVTPTYRKPDGNTPGLLKRCIDSVVNQTNQDYFHLIIGDRYEDESEILSLIPKTARFYNLLGPTERDFYSGFESRCCSGIKATIYGLKKLIDMGFEYLIMLDHDEWWAPNHLQLLSENGPFAWACTKSIYTRGTVIPNIETDEKVIPFPPTPRGVVKSSVCWNYKEIPVLARNVFDSTGEFEPGDVDMWKRMAIIVKEKNLKSIFINELTNFRGRSF